MIIERPTSDALSEHIDISLCDACGLLRMGTGAMEEIPRDVVAALITQARQDIGRLAQEHREAAQTIDKRLDTIAGSMDHRFTAIYHDIQKLQSTDDEARGRKAGAKDVIGYVIVLSGLIGGLIAWIFSHLPWQQKP